MAHTGAVEQATVDQVVVLRGKQELLARLGPLFDTPEREFTCAINDMSTWPADGDKKDLAVRMRARLDAGVTVRKLYNPEVLAGQDAAEHLTEMAALGAGIRICRTPLSHETIIVDGRVAVLASRGTGESRAYSVVRTPDVVLSMRTLFMASWESAIDLAEFIGSGLPVLDERNRSIAGMLGSGLTDEAAARRLGLSLRTYRRRVADLMALLDVESRFQAGLRARDLGVSLSAPGRQRP